MHHDITTAIKRTRFTSRLVCLRRKSLNSAALKHRRDKTPDSTATSLQDIKFSNFTPIIVTSCAQCSHQRSPLALFPSQSMSRHAPLRLPLASFASVFVGAAVHWRIVCQT
ncbi:hypothetical protein ElyMa_001737700 [Elysia marginata]|uniref:Uncharacterized protein n=1 Tax=Elysia marginata TaxID=1093978 RepID=A0AAV4JW70_9GAST|nr:hypothetical protein ElyMa_001737700 [Elysia marginata]